MVVRVDDEVDHYVEALRRFRGDVRMMEQVLATMIERGSPRTPVHLHLMLDEYLATRSMRKARAIVEHLEEIGGSLEPRHQYDLALSSAATGDRESVVAVLERLVTEQRDPTSEQAPTVLSLLLSSRRLPVAWPLYRRMRARGQQADRDTHLTLLADALDRRAAKDTLAVVRGMAAGGQHLPASRIPPLVRMLVSIGQLERALELLELAASVGALSASGSDDAFSAVLQALARKGRVDDCVGLIERSTANGTQPSSHHRNAVLEARIVSEDLSGAWEDAETMWADACLPTGANLERLLDLSLAGGQVARAAGLLDLLLVIGVPVAPHRSGAVLRAELASDGLERVLPMAARLLELEATFDRATGRDLVERLVRMRRLDDARAWLARFRASGTLTQGKGYGSLLHAYVAAKRVDDAVSLIEEMAAGKVAPVPNDVARIIAGRMKADDLVGAGRLLDAASSVGVHADESTLRELLWAHARKGEASAVERTMLRLTAAGITPDERHEKARAWASGDTPRRLEDTVTAADTSPAVEATPEGSTLALDDAAPAAEVSAEGD